MYYVVYRRKGREITKGMPNARNALHAMLLCEDAGFKPLKSFYR
jgi:hypothetical protein